MAMSVTSSGADDDVMVDINTTPLIDVMLVLLIMFIITIPIQTHAVKMNMPIPNTQQPPTPPKPPVQIVVDFDGTVGWNGVVVTLDELNQKFMQVAAEADQPEVHLRPNKLVTYKHVAGVMAAAQRLGVTKIGLVGNEQFL